MLPLSIGALDIQWGNTAPLELEYVALFNDCGSLDRRVGLLDGVG